MPVSLVTHAVEMMEIQYMKASLAMSGLLKQYAVEMREMQYMKAFLAIYGPPIRYADDMRELSSNACITHNTCS